MIVTALRSIISTFASVALADRISPKASLSDLEQRDQNHSCLAVQAKGFNPDHWLPSLVENGSGDVAARGAGAAVAVREDCRESVL